MLIIDDVAFITQNNATIWHIIHASAFFGLTLIAINYAELYFIAITLLVADLDATTRCI